MFFLTLAIFSVLVTSVLVDAAPARETNASRLKRGLPPLKPRFGRTVPGRPTRTSGAKRGGPSGTPSATLVETPQYSGRIGIRHADSAGDDLSFAYVNNWNFGQNFGPPNEELQITTSGANPFYSLRSTNPATGDLVGAKVGTLSLAPDSAATAGFGFVTQGAASQNTFAANQSAIWTIDSETRRLTPTVINQDGSQAPTTVAFDVRANSIFFVGDLAAYNVPNRDTPASAVELFLEDLE